MNGGVANAGAQNGGALPANQFQQFMQMVQQFAAGNNIPLQQPQQQHNAVDANLAAALQQNAAAAIRQHLPHPYSGTADKQKVRDFLRRCNAAFDLIHADDAERYRWAPLILSGNAADVFYRFQREFSVNGLWQRSWQEFCDHLVDTFDSIVHKIIANDIACLKQGETESAEQFVATVQNLCDKFQPDMPQVQRIAYIAPGLRLTLRKAAMQSDATTVNGLLKDLQRAENIEKMEKAEAAKTTSVASLDAVTFTKMLSSEIGKIISPQQQQQLQQQHQQTAAVAALPAAGGQQQFTPEQLAQVAALLGQNGQQQQPQQQQQQNNGNNNNYRSGYGGGRRGGGRGGFGSRGRGNGGGYYQLDRTANGTIICTRCGQPGHGPPTCTVSLDTVCYYCNKRGHLQFACFRNPVVH